MLINITIGLPVAKFPYICSSPLLTLQAAETCINLHEPGFDGLFDTCIEEAEEEISCQTLQRCATQSTQGNACDAETTAVFNCWGCGVCDEEGAVSIKTSVHYALCTMLVTLSM